MFQVHFFIYKEMLFSVEKAKLNKKSLINLQHQRLRQKTSKIGLLDEQNYYVFNLGTFLISSFDKVKLRSLNSFPNTIMEVDF